MIETSLAEVFPVGEHLADELEERGWTQAEFAEVLGRPAQFVSEIVSGKKEITRDSAAQIGAAFGSSAEYWLNLQDTYYLWLQSRDRLRQAELDAVRLRAQLQSSAPISVLTKRGYITAKDPEGQLQELLRLYGTTDISEKPAFAIAARRSNDTDGLTSTQTAWVACVRHHAANVPKVDMYSRPGLIALAERLARDLREPSKLVSLPAEFRAVGVKLIYVERFPSGKLDGCSLMMNGVPVIGLSGRGKRLDKVLFTLLHEIAHILLGHLGEQGIIVDEETDGHTLGDEGAANEQARKWILPQPLPPVPDRISAGWIERTAESFGLHPIVVIGRLQHHGLLGWRTALVKGAPTATDQLARW